MDENVTAEDQPTPDRAVTDDTTPSSQSSPDPATWKVGDVANGQVLTGGGIWVPLRHLPPNSPGPHHPGDVVNGHVFTGADWKPVNGLGGSTPGTFAPQPTPQKSRGGCLKAALIGGAALVVLIVVLAVVGTLMDKMDQPAGPDVQAKFVTAVQSSQSAAAENGAQVNQAKVVRGAAMCEILPDGLKVDDWRGTVDTIDDKLGGDEAILKIELAEGIAIEANAGLFDTGIKPGTDLYNQAAKLTKGQEVTFSGKFREDKTYCLEETSVMDENGLRTPTFAFEFSSIQ